MISETLVDISRLQFAFTALFHFIFVPLTLGLSLMLVIMESIYVRTGKLIYRDMTQFWGKLFLINFAMGVATGLTMEFQFGTNWAYYSHYVGDIFGVPLAIEGLMAFFLESTFIGLFFFGWDRLSRKKHLMVTALVALGSNLSALWILIANGWMQRPVGTAFNPQTMRMELANFSELFFNPMAQVKFLHTLSAGYLTGAVFVLAISAWYLIKGRDIEFAKRSFALAAAFGSVVSLGAIIMGDESGHHVANYQPEKLAAMEAIWHTESPPAPLTLIASIDEAAQQNSHELQIPALLGIIATRSLDHPIAGITELVANNEARIRSGLIAYQQLPAMRQQQASADSEAAFIAHKDDLGYALLLKKYIEDPTAASDAQISQAAADTIPKVTPMFWSFRLMVGLGFFLTGLMFYALFCAYRGTAWNHRKLLYVALFSLPLPWLAAELGWFVAEFGRQPWTVYGLLPTHLSASSLTVSDVASSLTAFALMYGALFVIEMYLMIKYARLGPSSLHTGRYHFEQGGTA